MDEVKFGLILPQEDGYKLYCSCGEVFTSCSNDKHCYKCDNTRFKIASKTFKSGTLVLNDYEVDKGDWGFKLKKLRTEMKYSKKQDKLTLVEHSYDELVYSFKDDTFAINYQMGARTVDLTSLSNETDRWNRVYIGRRERVLREFLGNKDNDLILQLISTENTGELFRYIYRKLGDTGKWGVNPYNLGRGLARFIKIRRMEILYKVGFTCEKIYNVVPSGCKETKPHKILGVPKYTLPYLKDIELSAYVLRGIQLLDERLGGNDTKIILRTLKEESELSDMKNFLYNQYSEHHWGNYEGSNFIRLIEEEKYQPKKLIEYICRKVKLEQGITNPNHALTTLKDYIRMCNEMGIKYERYSKSLKKDHDIANLNYKTIRDTLKNEQFNKIIEEDYSSILFKDDEYVIVPPKESNDLVKEGENLSHCVASYINDVIARRCKILFMRNKDYLDASLLTIEVRGNRIVQVRGFGNRSSGTKEREFIHKWAEKKELEIGF